MEGSIVDITDRKRTEMALRESESRYRTFFEKGPDGILVLDPQTARPIEFNDQACRQLGYSREEFSQLQLYDIEVTETAEEVQEHFHKVTDEGYDDFETLQRTKQGEIRHVHVTAQIIETAGGIVYHCIWRDITKRKLAEKEKADLESQLRQAQKIESLGTLSGGIAHEFNNLLGIIIGNTELAIADVPQHNRAYNSLEEILTASLRARDVVRQLLAFSRKTIEGLKPLRLTPIVKEAIKLIRSSIPTTIEIRQNLSAVSDTVKTNPTQINQVLINLCTNAVHAMQEEGGILEISLENFELGEDNLYKYHGLSIGTYVKLTVSDTGIGMTPETIECIFDPFFTTKEVGQGTGMGLSVVNGIVKEHGGDIRVQSAPGKGSTFHVFFPVVEWISETDVKPTEPTPRGTECILFVDDEKAIVLAAKQNLENLNYTVITETNPIQCLKTFSKYPQKFDILITDMTMPVMTGDKLAQEVMKIKPDMPVILCTGYSDRISEEKAQEIGVKAFVMKPVVTHDMAKTLRQVLDQAKKEKGTSTSKRILVVNDEEQMRIMIRRMLESEGFIVSEAPDGKVALWLQKVIPADLVITNLIMPEKDGIGPIGEMKHNFPDLKVIAISGGERAEKGQYLDMAKKMGADSTLLKPFEKKELLRTVRDLLG